MRAKKALVECPCINETITAKKGHSSESPANRAQIFAVSSNSSAFAPAVVTGASSNKRALVGGLAGYEIRTLQLPQNSDAVSLGCMQAGHIFWDNVIERLANHPFVLTGLFVSAVKPRPSSRGYKAQLFNPSSYTC